MAYVSSPNNQGLTSAANALTKIFVGDPAADAAYRRAAIDENTELLRQKNIQEQTLTEGVRRGMIAQQQANLRTQQERLKQQQGAFNEINKLFTNLPAQYSPEAVETTNIENLRNTIASNPIGQTVNNAPVVTADQLKRQAMENLGPLFAGQAIMAGIDPTNAVIPSAMLTVPQDADATRRMMLASGKDVSDTAFTTPGTSRVTDPVSGRELVPISPQAVKPSNPAQDRLMDARAQYLERRANAEFPIEEPEGPGWLARLFGASPNEALASPVGETADMAAVAPGAGPMMPQQPGGPAGGIVQVASPAEALALPPGTIFQTPDGRVKVRP